MYFDAFWIHSGRYVKIAFATVPTFLKIQGPNSQEQTLGPSPLLCGHQGGPKVVQSSDIQHYEIWRNLTLSQPTLGAAKKSFLRLCPRFWSYQSQNRRRSSLDPLSDMGGPSLAWKTIAIAQMSANFETRGPYYMARLHSQHRQKFWKKILQHRIAVAYVCNRLG